VAGGQIAAMISNMVTAEDKEDTPEEVDEVKQTGFVRERRCTDILCIILFFAHIVCFLVVSFMGMSDGNPAKLYKPRDYKGAYCGIGTNWNNGPNLENQPKQGFMMNVSSSSDAVARQLLCSTAAKDWLLSSSNLTLTQQNEYLCECCLSPCQKCTGSLDVGGDITGSISNSNVFSTITARMGDLTNVANAFNLFNPIGANGNFFNNIWDQATEYFVEVCLPSCTNNITTYVQANDYREYIYTPYQDEILRTAWDQLLNSPGASAWKDSFKFKAFPSKVCPYPASECVQFPGVEYVEVSNGYCTFSMGMDVVNAVGNVMASAFESAGGDSFAESATETFGQWIGDFEMSLDTFVIVCVCCFVIGLIYLVLLRYTVKFCVWFALFIIFLAFAVGGLFTYIRAHQCKNDGFFSTAQQTSVAVVVAGTTAVSGAISGNTVSEDCTGDCANYRGQQTRSRSGKLCQDWAVDTPHSISATYSAALYPNSGLTSTSGVSHNYCRNPYNATDTYKASTIWCFTTDAEKRWELCTPIGVIAPACTHGYAVSGQTMRDVLKVCSYVIWALALVWVLLVLCFFNRIRLAIALNEVAARFVATTPRIVIVPISQALIGIIWVGLWLLSAAFLMSQVPDSSTPTGSYATYAEAYGTETVAGKCTDRWPTGTVWRDTTCDLDTDGVTWKCWRCAPPRYIFDWRLPVSFFSFLWNNAFLIAFGQTLIAGAVGIWFFTPNSEKGKLGGCEAIRKSNWNVWRYHTGSLAFGSFVIALIQFIRYMMKFFEKQAQAQKNRIMALILRVVQCCIYCFERFIQFLNKNAYIQIAIRGTGFCTSAKTAFRIIVQNVLRFGTVAILGNVIHCIGYVFIMASTVVIGYFLMRAMHDDISPVIPMIAFACVSYVVGKLYMNVFGLAVDTCLQCVIFAEEKCPDGDFVPSQLKNVIDRSQAPAKKDEGPSQKYEAPEEKDGKE